MGRRLIRSLLHRLTSKARCQVEAWRASSPFPPPLPPPPPHPHWCGRSVMGSRRPAVPPPSYLEGLSKLWAVFLTRVSYWSVFPDGACARVIQLLGSPTCCRAAPLCPARQLVRQSNTRAKICEMVIRLCVISRADTGGKKKLCRAGCRSDEEEGSGSKYGRMEPAEDSMQDKERFARKATRYLANVRSLLLCGSSGLILIPLVVWSLPAFSTHLLSPRGLSDRRTSPGELSGACLPVGEEAVMIGKVSCGAAGHVREESGWLDATRLLGV
ncbi:hypothetical protein E2C01_001121 [Portunus trituberculatus]|uniref:Uncharacterized protein n=1 Tax=Portunus trituberculatus TaxID=210409 RepID=A0A5B7CH00_PORTR|nr:hypothetical protein [Portunus trituberculatus]